jgi:hypothetical protein
VQKKHLPRLQQLEQALRHSSKRDDEDKGATSSHSADGRPASLCLEQLQALRFDAIAACNKIAEACGDALMATGAPSTVWIDVIVSCAVISRVQRPCAYALIRCISCLCSS